MSLNSTPLAERIHIGILGKRNAGKSSLINAITGQNLAIVSDYKGTTTDPVYKTMELLPLGPVVFIDTPGTDDEGELGKLRVEKTYQVINKCDLVLLVIDGEDKIAKEDLLLWEHINNKKIPALLVINKIDCLNDIEQALITAEALKITKNCCLVSSKEKQNITQLKNILHNLLPQKKVTQLVGDLINPFDVVILVTPIDSSAPKGRLILPQQQVIRDLLDHKGVTMIVQPTELIEALATLKTPPSMVITDSQVFAQVNKIVPQEVRLTSFSILMARYKNSLYQAVKSVRTLDSIKDGDKILISEGCTHHRQCQDIGTVKLPAWIKQHTKANPNFIFTSGSEFPQDLHDYKLIIHCGACMLNEKEVLHRNNLALEQNIPMTNYGIAIAYMHGILKRTLSPLPEISQLLD